MEVAPLSRLQCLKYRLPCEMDLGTITATELPRGEKDAIATVFVFRDACFSQDVTEGCALA